MIEDVTLCKDCEQEFDSPNTYGSKVRCDSCYEDKYEDLLHPDAYGENLQVDARIEWNRENKR